MKILLSVLAVAMIGFMLPSAFGENSITGKWLDDEFEVVTIDTWTENKFQLIDYVKGNHCYHSVQGFRMETKIQILAEVFPQDPDVWEKVGVRITSPDNALNGFPGIWDAYRLGNVGWPIEHTHESNSFVSTPYISKEKGKLYGGIISYGWNENLDNINNQLTYPNSIDDNKDRGGFVNLACPEERGSICNWDMNYNGSNKWTIVEPVRTNGEYTFELFYQDEDVFQILDTTTKTLHFKSFAEECSGTRVYDWAISKIDPKHGYADFQIPKNGINIQDLIRSEGGTETSYPYKLTPNSVTAPVIEEPKSVIEEPEPEPIPTPAQESSEGGGCLIATAAYGSEMAPQVQFLRELRDNTVMSTQSGTAFMTGFNQFYYSFSPQIADYERENPVFKEAVKVTLTPLLTSLTLLNYVEIDSEEEMLGYGIGIILLNVGMYFVAPAVLIISLKKKLQK